MHGGIRRGWAGLIVAVAVLLGGGLARGDMLYAVDATTQVLEAIDTDTLQLTTIGPLGIADQYGGLAYDAASRTLYLLSGRGGNGLYTVNMTTGAATLVGFHGVNDLFGLAFDPRTNALYGSQFSTGNQLYRLDAATGLATLVGSTGLPRGLGGLAYNSATGTLVGVDNGLGSLYAVNPADGGATFLAGPGPNNDGGLAYDPTKNLYWNIDYDGNLYSIDPSAGYARTRRLSGLGPQFGLAFVATGIPAVVEPPSAVLLGIGAVGLACGSLRARRARGLGAPRDGGRG